MNKGTKIEIHWPQTHERFVTSEFRQCSKRQLNVDGIGGDRGDVKTNTAEIRFGFGRLLICRLLKVTDQRSHEQPLSHIHT